MNDKRESFLFQIHIYCSYEHNICLLVKQFQDYFHQLSFKTKTFGKKSKFVSGNNSCGLTVPDLITKTKVENCDDSKGDTSQSTIRFAIMVSHLRALSDEMLRKFISQIKEFRKVSIYTQTHLIKSNLDKLVVIILAFVYNK